MKCIWETPEECFVRATRPHVLVGVDLFLYGMYTVLYVLCTHILVTRKRNGYRAHVGLTTALYIVATIGMGFKGALYELEGQLLHPSQVIGDPFLYSEDSLTLCNTALIIITILANCLTDILLVSIEHV
ncbi:hypothetical protein PM082_024209 [Marasmius tenuissimus]|nr:hypothetical protein PM082_024209 [Marasmius tenuissimus]